MNWNPTNWLTTLLASYVPQQHTINFCKPAVVMIHGIFDSGSKMVWLAAKLSQQGYETFYPSLHPSNGTHSLEDLSKQLENKIHERFPKNRTFHVIGFSMGGLIARHWLTHFAKLSQVISFVTLSTPHCGTLTAYFHKGKGASQMRPRSRFLQTLERLDNRLQHLWPLSLYTPMDLMIIPAKSSCWVAGRSEIIWVPAHPLMVLSSKVASRITSYFKDRERASQMNS